VRGIFHFAFTGLALAALTACGGSGGGGGSTTNTVGGTVSGLAGSGLVLRDNGGDDLPVSASGTFTFATEVALGAAYAVTVFTQPTNPAQACVVTNGSGTMGSGNVTNVAVTCTNTYTVGGMVTGLTGSGLILQNNGGDDLAVSASGAFTFSAGLATAATYAVTVKTQPSSPTQSCVVTNGSSVIATANVTNVSVECAGVGRFAYVSNAADNTISVYSIDSTTGALAAVGTPVATGASPSAIAGSPDKQHVYVVNETPGNISVYSVDATTGALTEIAGSPFAAGTDPQALAFDPSGAYLYVANNGSDNLSAYAVDASTGALTPLATATYPTGTGPSAVSVDATGKFVFVANNGGSNNISVFAITAATGELTPVTGSPFAAGGNPYSLVFTNSEKCLYTANFNGPGSTISAFKVNMTTGALSAVTGSPFALSVDNYIATDRVGGVLYVTTGGGVTGYGILDAGVLVALPGSSVTTGANAYSVTVDPSGQFLYVANDGAGNVSGYKRNGGILTAIPGSPFAAGNRPDFIAIL
jgi:6-phosphogluconolactonase (cycloisomerase 2 family)